MWSAAREVRDEHGFPSVRLVGLTADRLSEVRGRVVSLCQSHVTPALAPVLDEVPTADPTRRVLVFTVIATGRAHALRQKEQSAYWVRVGSETKEARNGVLLRLLAAKGEVEPWDRRLAVGATVDDLDLLALRDTLVRMSSWDPSRGIDHWLDPDVRISTFMPPLCGREPLTGVVRPRNFAVLLFGREPQRFVPGAVAIFSMYPGTDRAEAYSERSMFDGTVLHQARHLIDRLNVEAIGLTDKSTGGADNASKYPVRALQEAVVNALVHRDYGVPDPVRVVAFADRVDIWSPGGLDHRLDRERFERGDVRPVWRNQALAWVFIKLQLAQSEGQGIPTIQRAMANEGCPPAKFELTDDSVACVLPAHPRHGRVRELLRIEDDVVHGRLERALTALRGLLGEDPYNVRTVALLARVARSVRDSGPVLEFVRVHRDGLQRFPAAAQLALADALLTSDTAPSGETADLARELLTHADTSRKDLAETRRFVANLLALEDEQAALDALTRARGEHPAWASDPGLLQLEGRIWYLFGARVRAMLKVGDLTGPVDERARATLVRHFDRAEACLNEALARGAEGPARRDAESCLSAIAALRGTFGA